MSSALKPDNPYYDVAAVQRSRRQRGLAVAGMILAAVTVIAVLISPALFHPERTEHPEVNPTSSPVPTRQQPGDSAKSDAKSEQIALGVSEAGPPEVENPSGSPAAPPKPASPPRACDGAEFAAPGDGRLSSQEMRAVVEKVSRDTGTTISVAWFNPVTERIETAGSAQAWTAWSTSKVPLAVAVSQAGKAGDLAGSLSAALRQSDNGAAEKLWQSLGTSNTARAQAVTQILRQAGDNSTTVPSTRERLAYTVFGQTQWSTASQVGFMMKLPCLAGAGPVVSNLGQVSSDQRWGMGRLPGATFKGGWGPGTKGGYLVRQLGWYRDSTGKRVPLAIAAQAGSFDGGISALNQLIAALD